MVGAAEAKSPKSPKPLDTRCAAGLGGGGWLVLATGVGLLSKKLPPARGEVGDMTELRGEARLANGDGAACCCCCCCCCAGGEEKLRPPKASPRLARDCALLCCGACCAEEANPPKALEDCCCCCAAGLGTEAYNDRIDCLRSVLWDPPGEVTPDAALAGRCGGADWLEPKKSRPSKDV